MLAVDTCRAGEPPTACDDGKGGQRVAKFAAVDRAGPDGSARAWHPCLDGEGLREVEREVRARFDGARAGAFSNDERESLARMAPLAADGCSPLAR